MAKNRIVGIADKDVNHHKRKLFEMWATQAHKEFLKRAKTMEEHEWIAKESFKSAQEMMAVYIACCQTEVKDD